MISGLVVASVVIGSILGPGVAVAAADETVTVAGRVFDDANANGVFDEGESAFPGAALQIMDATENPVPDPADPSHPWTITTDAEGKYSWQVPPLPGPAPFILYSVALLSVPEGYQGNGGALLPDNTYWVGTKTDLNTPGAVEDTVDFALTKIIVRGPVVFGGAVWNDTDRDGIRDEGEPGFAGLIVQVHDQEGNRLDDPGNVGQPLEAVTEDDGSYRFDTLPYLDDGQFYTAAVTTVPEGFLPTSGQEPDGYGGYTRPGTVALTEEGAEDLGVDFGFAKIAGVTVSGAVYVDADRDGVRGQFERPLPDLTLTVVDGDGAPVRTKDGQPVTATTDATGAYRFTELPVLPVGGAYRVVLERLPDGYESTTGLSPSGEGVRRESTADLSTAGASDTAMDFPLASRGGAGSDGDWLVMPDLHADVLYPEIDTDSGGGQRLALRAHVDTYDPIDWNDVVIHHTDGVKETLPAENTATQDYSFVAAPGSTVWRSKESAAVAGASPWIGFSTQSHSLDELPMYHPMSFRLDAVTNQSGGAAPGDVILWTGSVSNPTKSSSPVMSTREGLPQAYTFGRGKHTHMNWSFTAPGVYCMAFSVTTNMPDGSRQEAHGYLTQIVGSDYDPSTIEPCGRHLTYPVPPVWQPIASNDAAPVIVTGHAAFGVGLDAGVLSATLDRAAPHFDRPAESLSIDDVVVHGGPIPDDLGYGQGPALTWNALGMPADALRGDVTWSIDKVVGPGQVKWTNAGEYSDQQFDTDAGQNTQLLPAAQTGNRGPSSIRVTRPGLYCIDMSWSASTASGTRVTDSHTLTFVADGPLDPKDYDLAWKEHGKDGPFTGPVWRGAEQGALDKTCAQGAVPTRAEEVPVPGGGTDPDPEAPVWDVPNWSRTDSGALILNDGHLDVASTLDGGVFDTQVKDTTAEGVANATRDGASWHDPSDVVMQLLPSSETLVPADEKYRFLGAAGAPVWLVTETQQVGLLWPGWSTESIPLTATTTGVDWRLDRVSGPGEFSLSKGGSELGSVDVLMNTRDGITAADRVTIPKHAHVHGDWAFSAEGVYCLGFTRSTTLPDGASPSDSFTLAVAVGEVSVKKVDPGSCFTDKGQPSTSDTTPVPEVQLTDATNGGVQVLGAAQGFLAGQLVTVKTGAAPLGSWVSVWVHPATGAPVWAGWAQVNSAGAAQVRLPVSLAVGSHKLVVKDNAGTLLGWDVFAVVAPADTASPPPAAGGGGGGAVPAAAVQCTPSDVAVIGAGHLDWNAQLVGGKLESLVGDDSTGTRVYRDPASTVLWLKPGSRQTLPSGYGQIGAAGTSVWQVPQTQNPDLIWLGWSTELLNAGNAASGVSWSLDRVDGPGSVKVYTAGSFGGVQTMVFDGGGSYRIPLGVHAHANWAFSAEGIYRLRFTQSVTLAGGQVSSDTETLTIAVGDVNPNIAVSAGSGCGVVSTAIRTGTTPLDAATKAALQAQADAAEAAATVLPDGRSTTVEKNTAEAATPFAALAAGNPVPLLLSILGALLLVGAAGSGMLWWRREKDGSPA